MSKLTFVSVCAVRLDRLGFHIGFEMGRVQVFQHGQWSGVCGTGWDDADALVTCRELGFNYGKVRAHTGVDPSRGTQSPTPSDP